MSTFKLQEDLERHLEKLMDISGDASFTKKGNALVKLTSKPATWDKVLFLYGNWTSIAQKLL